MGTYQDCVVSCVYHVLSGRNALLGGEPDTVHKVLRDALNDMIRHYPEVIEVVEPRTLRHQIHVWVRYMKPNMLSFFHHPFLMSEQAYQMIQRGNLEEIRNKDSGLYQEHITPVNFIINRLLALEASQLSMDSVRQCFAQCSLVFLKVGEQKYLDGKKFSRQDVDLFLSLVEAEGQRGLAESFVGKSCKSNGPGLLRMCKLRNEGIDCFCNWRGESVEPQQWLQNLSRQDFVVNVNC